MLYFRIFLSLSSEEVLNPLTANDALPKLPFDCRGCKCSYLGEAVGKPVGNYGALQLPEGSYVSKVYRYDLPQSCSGKLSELYFNLVVHVLVPVNILGCRK